jgi:hypothetical protein
MLSCPQEFGIDIAKLTNEGGKELVFNEFGVGGGISPSGDQPARTSEQVRTATKQAPRTQVSTVILQAPYQQR